MRLMIIGASAGLGRALAEEMARRGHHLLLVATDARDLAALSAHLSLRYTIRAEYLECRLAPGSPGVASITAAAASFGSIEGLLFPIGFSIEDDQSTLDECSIRQLVEANFLCVACLVAHCWPVFLKQGYGSIVGFGSVAAIRGRKRNVIYSAAKRALSSYFESLRHAAANTGIRVQFYQVGYLDTSQNFGRKLILPRCPPERVASRVAENLLRDTGVVFLPRFWMVVDVVVRCLPWSIFRRLDF